MFDVSMCGTGYKLLKEVGSGGMGKVYQAKKSDTGEICAIKVMHNHMSGDQNNRKRFEREARVTCGLNQENVVETIDCGVTKDNQPFIVMEYLEGSSLADLLEQKGRIDLQEFYPLLVQICRGLAYTHNMMIVHRDMKPSNIMLVESGGEIKAKIVDFGIAKICPRTGNCMPMSDERLQAIDEWNELDDEDENLIQVLTAPGEVFGSPLYMSPEQCRGEVVDCCSEVYSLGCMIFECLTGVAPLKGRNAMETLFQRITMSVPSINSVVESLTFPPQIEAIVAKALEKERRDRYQSVCELKMAVMDAGKSLNLVSTAVSA